MGWGDLGKLAKSWLEAEKTELLTGDHNTREAAEREREQIERAAKDKAVDDATYAVLGRVLPPDLAQAVEASRPENRAARRDAEHRADLATRPLATVAVPLTGAVAGARQATVACALTPPDPDDEDEQPALLVELEVADPIPFGSTTFAALSVRVPDYHGPGRYDLQELWRRTEAGELSEWELLDTCLRPLAEPTELDWVWHQGAGAGVLVVTDTGLTLDLAMSSAANDVRLQGTIDWSSPAD
jgi:hypothetical protein